MRALVWNGPYSMGTAEVEEPVAIGGEALVAVSMAGICGSDITAYKGIMGISAPGSVRGHEFAGVVIAVGDPADARWVGERVSVNPVVSCGTCWACLSSRDNLCPRLQLVGVHRPGGFAERVSVPVRNLGLVNAELSWEAAASAEPLAQACHDMSIALQGELVDNVLVIGAGSIGHFVVAAAHLSGVAEITVIDPNPDRRDAAIAVGAARAFASTDEAIHHAKKLERGGFDAVFDVVGAQATREASVDLARNGGAIIMVGLHTDRTEFPWFTLSRREISVTGSNCFTRGEFATALSWLNTGRVALTGSSSAGPLDEGPALFAAIADGASTVGKTYLLPA
jgi:2-desacetyl-2-hydroxyethyl bacteriochlorophyllide A dehydrogenase